MVNKMVLQINSQVNLRISCSLQQILYRYFSFYSLELEVRCSLVRQENIVFLNAYIMFRRARFQSVLLSTEKKKNGELANLIKSMGNAHLTEKYSIANCTPKARILF